MAVPLVVALCFGVVGPSIARALPPRHATWLLSLGGVASALSGLAVLSLLASVLVGQLPEIASQGHWSASTLREHGPAESGIEVGALIAAISAAVAIAVVAGKLGRGFLSAYRRCRNLPESAGDLVVVAGVPSGALAVPGRPGRIVVAQSLLAALSAGQRRALLAHERSHLEHRHHWHLTAVALAASANPLLGRLRGAVALAVERWADEDAAAEVGDRSQVAEAVARAAVVIRQRPARAGPLLAAAASAVPERVAALLGRPREPRPVMTLLAAALLLAGVAAAILAGKETEHLFEFAGRVYRATHAT
jgi:Zn-dependent protease with chaperone function